MALGRWMAVPRARARHMRWSSRGAPRRADDGKAALELVLLRGVQHAAMGCYGIMLPAAFSGPGCQAGLTAGGPPAAPHC
jgi:hypothetical protein